MQRLTRLAPTLLLVAVALHAPRASAQKPEAVILKRQGDNHLAQGAPDKAVEAYRKAIETDPRYKDAYNALAAHYLRTRKYARAVTVLRQALGQDPDHAESWYNLGYALRKQGKLDAAIGAYRRFAQLRPNSADPYYGIGLALKAQGKAADAARAFRSYARLERNPEKKVWVDRAVKQAEELEKKAGIEPQTRSATPNPNPVPKAKPKKPTVDSTPRPATLAPTSARDDRTAKPVTPERERAMQLKARGDRFARQGKLADAARLYRQAVKADYSYTAAYNELGTALFGLKRYDEAVRTFRIALRDNPDYHVGWYNLAYALRKSGRLLPAIAAYNKFIEARPNDPDPYFGLGLAYQAAGNKPEAIRAFKRYIKLERRQAQEKWVHKARVEVARMEGRPPPEYVPGQVIVAAPKVAPRKPLTARERRRLAREERKRKAEERKRLRAEKRRQAAEARKAKREAARLARAEKRRALKEKRRLAREERKRKAEERMRLRAEKRRQAVEARKAKREAARLAREEKRRAREARSAAARPGASDHGAVAAAPVVTPSLAGVDPAPDVILSPPMPAPPASAGSTPAERYRAQGDTLARAGKLQQAARSYDRAVKANPFDTRAYDGLAYAAFKLGAYKQGARRMSVAIRDNPDYAAGWLHQARLYRAAKDNVKAVGSYRKYLEKRPRDVEARLELARTLKALDMHDQAVAEYRAAAKPDKVAGNEAYVVAARAELRGLGVTPPALAAGTGVAVTPAPGAPAPTTGLSPAEARKAKREAARLARAAKRRAAAEARKARREAARLAREEKIRALKEKRRKAAEARKARREAARLAREEKIRALKEKRRKAAEARKRRLAERRRRREERRRARRRSGGKRAAGTDVAEAVGQDLDESTPPVVPRPRMHDVLRPAPDAARGLVQVADQQFARKRYVVALGIYQQAAKLDPGSSEPLYKAGVAAVALGQMHLAADLFTRVLKIDPGNATAKVNLKMAEAAAQGTKPSADYVETAVTGVKEALREGRYALAEQQAGRLLKQSVSAKLHLLRAEARLALRKPNAALLDGGRALSLDPASNQAFRVMGDAHRQLGHRDKAVYYYRLYLARTSDDDAAAGERKQIEQLVSELVKGE